MKRNDPCWCGSGYKIKQCRCPSIYHPQLLSQIKQIYKQEDVRIKSTEQIEGIRRACKLAAVILDKTCERAQAGVSLSELNDYAHELHLQAGAKPAPLGYGSPPFPKSICTSVNEVICHGIPGPYKLKDGDIINFDVTVVLDGYYGDCSKMVCIGDVKPQRMNVVKTCYEALMASIEALQPMSLLSEVGNIITKIAHKNSCSVVRDFVGHGVGIDFHEGPNVLHCTNSLHIPLVPGLIFTIEPMLNEGCLEHTIDDLDGWTVRTADGKVSAQWEHTILMTQNGAEILTPWTPPNFLLS